MKLYVVMIELKEGTLMHSHILLLLIHNKPLEGIRALQRTVGYMFSNSLQGVLDIADAS